MALAAGTPNGDGRHWDETARFRGEIATEGDSRVPAQRKAGVVVAVRLLLEKPIVALPVVDVSRHQGIINAAAKKRGWLIGGHSLSNSQLGGYVDVKSIPAAILARNSSGSGTSTFSELPVYGRLLEFFIAMKLVAGAILLLASEQAYAHSQLIQFPNHELASSVLTPAALVLAVLGSLVFLWGLLTDTRPCGGVHGGNVVVDQSRKA